MWWLVGKLARGGGTNWTQAPSAPAPAAHHGSDGLLIIVLVLAALIVVPFVAGVAMQARKRGSTAAVSSRPGRVTRQQPVVPRTPIGGYRRAPAPKQDKGPDHESMVEALFAKACPTCGEPVGKQCKLIHTEDKAAIVDSDINAVCHMARIVLGCEDNPKLYVDLIRNWKGPVPRELKGLHADEVHGRQVDRPVRPDREAVGS